MQLSLAGDSFRAFLCFVVCLSAIVRGEDPYRFFNWNVTYGDIYPLGVRQQVCVHSVELSLFFLSLV